MWADLDSRQPNTNHCTKGLERKRQQLAGEEALTGMERYFREYFRLITNVADFNCFGHILMAMDDDCPAVVSNRWKSWNKWEWMLRIILREGSNVWTSGEISTWWCRRLSSLTQRRGWWPPTLEGLWGGSNTGWTAVWMGSSLGCFQTADGSTSTPYPPTPWGIEGNYMFSITPELW